MGVFRRDDALQLINLDIELFLFAHVCLVLDLQLSAYLLDLGATLRVELAELGAPVEVINRLILRLDLIFNLEELRWLFPFWKGSCG